MGSPEIHDYDSAAAFLSLIMSPAEADKLAALLEADPDIVEHPAKDLVRAAGLLGNVPPKSNEHVAKDLRRIDRGEALSPVLLVRDAKRGVLLIADGFHRIAAAWHTGENTPVPAKIITR